MPVRPGVPRLAGAAAALGATLLLAGCGDGEGKRRSVAAFPNADPRRAEAAVRQYGCGACHVIGGIPGATGRVGPPLDGIARRALIAGRAPNTPETLVRWIVNPHELDEHTMMPVTGISPEEARDVAAYLYTR